MVWWGELHDFLLFALGVVLGMLGAHYVNQRKIKQLRRELRRVQTQFLRLIGGF